MGYTDTCDEGFWMETIHIALGAMFGSFIGSVIADVIADLIANRIERGGKK